jgi:hypothetical protein
MYVRWSMYGMYGHFYHTVGWGDVYCRVMSTGHCHTLTTVRTYRPPYMTCFLYDREYIGLYFRRSRVIWCIYKSREILLKTYSSLLFFTVSFKNLASYKIVWEYFAISLT